MEDVLTFEFLKSTLSEFVIRMYVIGQLEVEPLLC
jgi:hypothetical protein